MKLATWNINSIRLRKENVIKFLKKENIDIIFLQETKTIDKFFPESFFYNYGYTHIYFRGEKSYNGVAVLSKIPFKNKSFHNFCNLKDTRHLKIELINNIIIHNFYVPAGGDVPDIKLNVKFKHKIDFMNEMIELLKMEVSKKNIILGDFNIAPSENDVWSHKTLLKQVSHTKVETDVFKKLLEKCSYEDIVRKAFNKEDKIFSWWSYRNKDWKKSNRGRRLDHILVSNNFKKNISNVNIYNHIRGQYKPSDHVPISITLKD
mgnify:CR=1 FL=1